MFELNDAVDAWSFIRDMLFSGVDGCIRLLEVDLSWTVVVEPTRWIDPPYRYIPIRHIGIGLEDTHDLAADRYERAVWSELVREVQCLMVVSQFHQRGPSVFWHWSHLVSDFLFGEQRDRSQKLFGHL